MVLKRLGCVFVLALVLSITAHPSSAGSDDLTGNVEAFRVVKNAEGKEMFLSAREAHPRDVIEYRLTYKNTGNSPIKNISIVDPVPFGMVCIPTSTTKPLRGEVEFSIDRGKSYHSWPVKVAVKATEGKEEMKKVTPDMITHIRWVFSSKLSPEDEVTVSYRASVR